MAAEHECAVADPFVQPASDLAKLHASIVDALAELHGARRIYEHSPTSENQRAIDLCDWRLDHLLARQTVTTQAASV